MKKNLKKIVIVFLFIILCNFNVYAENKVNKNNLQEALDYVTKESYEKITTEENENGGITTIVQSFDYTDYKFKVNDNNIEVSTLNNDEKIILEYELDDDIVFNMNTNIKKICSYEEFIDQIYKAENLSGIFYTAIAKIYGMDIYTANSKYKSALFFSILENAFDESSKIKYLVTDDEDYDFYNEYYSDSYIIIKNSEFKEYSKEYLKEYFNVNNSIHVDLDLVSIDKKIDEENDEAYVLKSVIKFNLSENDTIFNSDNENNTNTTDKESNKEDKNTIDNESNKEDKNTGSNTEKNESTNSKPGNEELYKGVTVEENNRIENQTPSTNEKQPNVVENKQNNIIDNTVTTTKIPNAGLKRFAFGFIITLVGFGIISYRKYINLKDVK